MITSVRWLRVSLLVVLATLVARTALAAETANELQALPGIGKAAAENETAVSVSPRLPANESPYGRDTVWANTATGMYHRDGDRWYGKTAQGRYMSEDQAIRAGYRLSKHTETP